MCVCVCVCVSACVHGIKGKSRYIKIKYFAYVKFYEKDTKQDKIYFPVWLGGV